MNRCRFRRLTAVAVEELHSPSQSILAAAAFADRAYGLPVTATTSQPLNASTATTTSFVVTEDPGGTDVPRRILVPGGTTLQATASLLPNINYRATITALAPVHQWRRVLAAPYTWTFKTRPIVTFPLADGTAAGISYFGRLALGGRFVRRTSRGLRRFDEW